MPPACHAFLARARFRPAPAIRTFRRVLLAALTAALALFPAMPASAAPAASPALAPAASAREIHVSPDGSDKAAGTAPAPLRTITAALRKATAGTTIRLAPGTYRERVKTVRSGTAQAPIRIAGPETGFDRSGRYKAVLYGTSRVVSIDHDYIELSGFTIDGQEKLAGVTYPVSAGQIDSWKDSVRSKVRDGRLVYLGAADSTRGVHGVRLSGMWLSGAGGECVRMRNNASGNVIERSTIQYCGMYGKGGGSDKYRYHNGEGVYIGTSPRSGGQPLAGKDASNGNRVIGNVIRTFGSECFDVKEHAFGNVFAGNTCSANMEARKFGGSNVELRGHGNIVSGNVISGSRGWNVKIQPDSARYDRGGNYVTGNRLSDAAGPAVRIRSSAVQGAICGNEISVPVLLEQVSITGKRIAATVSPAAACAQAVPWPVTPLVTRAW